MLTNDIAKKIQDDLHQIIENKGLDLVLNITDNIQKYESDMINADEMHYTPAVLTLVGSPFNFDSLGIEIRNYRLRIYGYATELRLLEGVMNDYIKESNIGTEIGAQKVFINKTGLISPEFINSQDGFNIKRYESYVDVQLQIMPYTYDGTSISISVDGNKVPYRSLQYRKDKSIIQNIAYGNNNSDIKMVTDTIVIEFPLTANATIQSLFGETLDASYNKAHLLEIKVGGITKTMSTTTRVGLFSSINNPNPLTFSMTFEIALPRNFISIDGVTFPILKNNYTGENIALSQPFDYGDYYKMVSSRVRFQNSLNLVIVLPKYEVEYFQATFNADETADGDLVKLFNLLPNIGDTMDCVIEGSGVNEWFNFKRESNIKIRIENETHGFILTKQGANVLYWSIIEGKTFTVGTYDFEVAKNIDQVKAQQLIDEMKKGKESRVFEITEIKYGKNYTSKMMLQRGAYNDSENADLFLDCNFILSEKDVT